MICDGIPKEVIKVLLELEKHTVVVINLNIPEDAQNNNETVDDCEEYLPVYWL